MPWKMISIHYYFLLLLHILSQISEQCCQLWLLLYLWQESEVSGKDHSPCRQLRLIVWSIEICLEIWLCSVIATNVSCLKYGTASHFAQLRYFVYNTECIIADSYSTTDLFISWFEYSCLLCVQVCQVHAPVSHWCVYIASI